MKNIILCSDGTGNAGGQGSVTNVWRLFTALDLSPNEIAQVAIHDDGVGTDERKIVKVIGGAFGLGLKRNVRELYRFLIRNYEPHNGDQIYIFGFSRGAYTARMLAGLITHCGIIDPKEKDDKTIDKLIKEAFSILRLTFLERIDRKDIIKDGMLIIRGIKKKGEGSTCISSGQKAADEFAKLHCHLDQNNGSKAGRPYLIRFVGVWDTVPAYGFPIQEVADLWNYAIYPYKFDDRRLSSQIRQAAHALSIDDTRKTFEPMLFENDPDRIEQVWFSGMHANVGGGYPKDGLAYISLDWMITRASRDIDGIQGLRFIEEKRNEYSKRINPFAKMYNSRSGLGVMYRYEPRNIKLLAHENKLLSDDDKDKHNLIIHPSVIQRIQARTEDYAPGNIPKDIELSDQTIGTTQDFVKHFRDNYDPTLLLEGNAQNIKIRQYLHASKIAIPVMMLIIAKSNYASEICGTNKLLFIDGLFSNFTSMIPYGDRLYQWAIQPILRCDGLVFMSLIMLGITWGIGHHIKIKMQNNYSVFWSKMVNSVAINKEESNSEK